MTTKAMFKVSVRFVALLAVATGLLAAALPPVAQAQSNTANTLKVTPVRTDIQINPGESKTVQTTVSNLTGDAITVRPTSNDFVAGDESGTPSLILNENQFAPSHSLKRFMGPLNDVTIPANGTVSIDVVITVPANATPAGYFGAVRFAPSTPDSGGQVNLSPSVASIILLTVPGPVTEKLSITDFTVQQGGRSNGIFYSDTGISASVRFKSESSIQLGPIGKVSVKKGDTVVYETDFNNKTPRDVILPDSARRWDIPLEKISGFGHYTVLATYTYGQTNQTIEATESFWVIPWLVIAIAGGVLLLIIAAIIITILTVKKRRNRNIRVNRSGGGLRL
jgi:hypothetical protein